MRRFFFLYLGFLFVIALCVPAPSLYAQTPADLTIEAVPSNPQPGEVVTLTAVSYSQDLSQSFVSWKYNGKSAGSGIGDTTVTVVAPAAGTTATVITTATGGGTASITIHPGSVDVLWEAIDAYTPPFYKGKALLPVGGTVRVTAIPAANTPTSLSYTWSRNGSAIPTVSGYGKSSFLFQQSALSPQEKIDLSLHNNLFSTDTSITVAPSTPKAIAYLNKEGFVDYANGYDGTIPITTSGVVLHFEPYYFSVPESLQQDLSIDTKIDGSSVHTSPENEVGLSRPKDSAQSILTLAIRTTSYSLQHLEKTFTLLFN